ncbi:HIT family protein [Dysgonomonas sp. HDW5A]|uniref:HIT family protein n=1 Tax=Dysgonomonas sp. HDW5A TaxID=2714926 RepID=UPI00140B68D9|nr:HIT family protein [Dysgonomonas sp. HDW5A]QIK59355.1 HIT family protein [Dysgonomonas sp. HDW5A]
MATIFSKIIKGEIPCYKIAENDNFFAFLDIRPMAKGHVLVIPKHETDYLFDLDDDVLSEMIVYSKKIAKAIQRAVPCKRIGLMVIGMEVPHAHIHLIPINAERDMNLSNPRLKLLEDEFQQITKDIISELENI